LISEKALISFTGCWWEAVFYVQCPYRKIRDYVALRKYELEIHGNSEFISIFYPTPL
jgi:hypothetical protein